ncbi:MAG: hypothetical protein H5T69_15875 [Chloroflexi bacterium]|nr:hypothetical protein [Chloroflexota bacterium]
MNTLSQIIALLPAGTAELVGTWVAALLTLAILSYVFGENPFFRFAEYLFVGIAAGYAGALAWNHVLWPRLHLLLDDPYTYWHYGIFFVLGLLLLARGVESLSSLGNLPLAVLFGTGAALAAGGALAGSLIPQMGATVRSISPTTYGGGLLGWAYAIDAFLLILGTIATLATFHYAARGRGPLNALGEWAIRTLGRVGQKFIMIAFGALFAGALLTFFAVLRSRIEFLLFDWLNLFGVG